MFWCIESESQLKKFAKYDFSNVFIQPILGNDNYHPKLSDIVAIYIRPFKSKSGFIVPINHSESINELNINQFKDFIYQNIGKGYTSDYKKFLHTILNEQELSINCIKTYQYLKTGEVLDDHYFDTNAHKFFYSKYYNNEDVNRIIPLVKHLEKWDNYFDSLKLKSESFVDKYYKFYSNIASKIFYEIESSGVKLDSSLIKSENNLDYSYKDGKHYTNYNLFTQTGRPSNSFNGLNLGALNKSNTTRDMIVPSNDFFVEYDYSSYHPRILCELMGYTFEDADIHKHLGKLYFEKNELTEEEYDESKKLTFKFMYTDTIPEELSHLEFFIKIKEYKDELWNEYKKIGHIKSPISGKPIRGIEQKTQILPYILQVYETERNIIIMKEVLELLKDKYSKLVHYCYDSFLIDLSKKDGKELVNQLKDIFEQDNFTVNVTWGMTYGEMVDL